MKPCFLFPSKLSVQAATLLVLISLLLTGTALAAPTNATPPAPAFNGVPFGPLQLPDGQYALGQYSGALMSFRTHRDPMASLALAKANHMRLWISLTEPQVKDSHNHFDLAAWEAQVNKYRALNLNPYIADGTILSLVTIDEPQDDTSYGGAPVPYASIEAACGYALSLWPTLRCGAYTEATFLDGAPANTWHALTTVISQYAAKKGPIDSFAANNAAAAARRGLRLYFAMNVLDGSASGGKVSGADLQAWGTRLLAEPSACGLTWWNFDATYQNRFDVAPALSVLRGQAAGHASCR